MLYVSAEIGVRLIAEYFRPTKYNNSNILRIYTLMKMLEHLVLANDLKNIYFVT